MSAATISKAARLVNEGCVELRGGCVAYTVRSGDLTYDVVLADEWATCSCPAYIEDCAHVLSARLQHEIRGDEMAAKHAAKQLAASS